MKWVANINILRNEVRMSFRMKKLFTVLLTAFIVSVSITGCGSKQNAADNAPGQENVSTQAQTSAASSMSLTEIVDAVYAKKSLKFPLMTMNVELTDTDALRYNTGLANADKIKEAVVSEPMMGSQAYSMVLVRLNNAADAKEVAQEMKNGIDQRKWICVEADDLKVAASGDVVMLVMISSTFADTATAADFIGAFKEISGTLSVEL